jgi:DNA polymerase-3 subunit delta'
MSEKESLYPWLQDAWGRLQERRGALPHALLLQGRGGLGKTALARRFAQGLLCEAPGADGVPCETCAACGWFRQGNHPDFRQVEPEVLSAAAAPDDAPAGKAETLSKQIRIEQIRELQTFLAVGSHRGGLRIVLIRPAEAMNAATANALLKGLEEPGPRTLFLLVSSQPQRLLPTIRSRCQALQVAVRDRTTALHWLGRQDVRDPEAELAFAGLAPLAVLEQAAAADARERLVGELARMPFLPLAAADRCAAMEAPALVDGMQKWLYDLARASAGLPVRYFPRHEPAVRAISTTTDRAALLRFARELARARASAQHPLNPRLYMEDLFIRYAATQGSGHA